ncbi:DUF4397 domain-containing protein [Hymenobacter yonginensis]|uniref:DUF4397 domain-containing protein n=1 Tax=Hymenobacter yonginensis TaxID=748197 RepID=A0ABY7PND5_9BACT|nr:DUF4397 domain-containing protein [Hymenobacter yonginensis]WBO84770.1 DUF4397 domain-containing protein [Hymenobacter yonginensis]
MKHALLLALSATAILFSACAKDDDLPAPAAAPTAPSPVVPPVVNPGYVRVVNNLAVRPGSNVQQGAVQLQVDFQSLGPAAAIATASPYQALSSGERAVQVALPVSSGSGWVSFSRLPIAKDQRYSLFTYSNGSQTSARVVQEAALPAPVAGKAQLRVLNLAAESTPVRIEESAAPAALYPEVAWGSITGYQAVDARAYTLYASRTNGNYDPLFNQAVTLVPGKAYTLVLRGSNYPDVVAPEKLAFDLIEDE